jgi:Holliday junction resolvase
MVRTVARVDSNQKSIVDALRKSGCSVQHLHQIGHGCPDLLVCRGNTLYLMELKDGSKPKSSQKLTADEIEWHRKWTGTVHIVHSAKEALSVVGVLP